MTNVKKNYLETIDRSQYFFVQHLQTFKKFFAHFYAREL